MSNNAKIKIDFTNTLNKIENATEKTAFGLGMELKENLRNFMHRDTEAMVRSVQNPVIIRDGDKVGVRVSINKEYANYQDQATLTHREGYQSGNTRLSSFRYSKDKSLEDRIKETNERMESLNPDTKLYKQKQNTLTKLRESSKNAYDYGRGYRRDTGKIKGVAPSGGIVKEKANFVFKSIKKTLESLKEKFSKNLI